MTSSPSKAVSFARAQVGKDYLFGAAGPDAFDCSGLVLRALETIGLELPHNSGQQAAWFKQRGRLVRNTTETRKALSLASVAFYYGDFDYPLSVTHCALYVGRTRLGIPHVVAAVDANTGVIEHALGRFLAPIAFGVLA